MKTKMLGMAAILSLSGCGDSKTEGMGGGQPDNQRTGNIVEVAGEAGQFTTLITAVQEAGLVETLEGVGPFTVFAPTDAAFAALPEGALEALLANKEALKNVLLYHVVAGAAVRSETAVTLTAAEMANGDSVAVELRAGNLFLNASKVISTDIEASNGIIHVIDAVLLPPERLGNMIESLGNAQRVDGNRYHR